MADNKGVLVNEGEFKELRFRLFKKFGRNSAGNTLFIESTVKDTDAFFKEEYFLKATDIFVLYRNFDKEQIFFLNDLNAKNHWTKNRKLSNESILFFDKSLKWVVNIFDESLI